MKRFLVRSNIADFILELNETICSTKQCVMDRYRGEVVVVVDGGEGGGRVVKPEWIKGARTCHKTYGTHAGRVFKVEFLKCVKIK